MEEITTVNDRLYAYVGAGALDGPFLFLRARCSKIETISYMVRKRKPIKVNIFRRAVEGAGPYMRVLLVR